MRLLIIDLGLVEYVTLHYVISACTGKLICEIFAKKILPIVYNGLSANCNYLLCNKKDIAY